MQGKNPPKAEAKQPGKIGNRWSPGGKRDSDDEEEKPKTPLVWRLC